MCNAKKQIPFLPDNYNTYDLNDKNPWNILMRLFIIIIKILIKFARKIDAFLKKCYVQLIND